MLLPRQRLVRELTKQSIVLVFVDGGACVEICPPSKGSSIEILEWWEGLIRCAMNDPAVGVWLLDSDLADLINSPSNKWLSYKNHSHIRA